MQGEEVLKLLRREDKWFLGGGQAVIWAPEFPVWLETPGFWDHACYLDYRVGPIFTLSIVESSGREVKSRFEKRLWQPDGLIQTYSTNLAGLRFVENRSLLQNDVLIASYEFFNDSSKDISLDLILWNAQEQEGGTRQGPSVSEVESVAQPTPGSALVLNRRIRETGSSPTIDRPDNGVLMRFSVAFRTDLNLISTGIKTSDREPNHPHWRFTPFYEFLSETSGKSIGTFKEDISLADFGGLVFMGLHYRVSVPVKGKISFKAAAAVAGNRDAALKSLNDALNSNSPASLNSATSKSVPLTDGSGPASDKTKPSTQNWKTFFEEVPSFTCSDPFLQKYYWYRWYGLKLNTVNIQDARLGLHHPCVFEGVNLGWFRQHISYSAQCHMFETRWMHDPSLARGSLLNFIENQYSSGSFPGAIKNIYQGDRTLNPGIAFYHANWGQAVKAVHAVHPDREFLQKIYEPLVRYLLYFDRDRDQDQTGLYDVLNHWETGQEYMSRYMEVDRLADEGGQLRLKGVDATSYIYQLQIALHWMAEQLEKPDDARRWQAMAEKTRKAVLSCMWDKEQDYFFDVNPTNMSRIKAKTPIGLYPFMTGLAGKEHLAAFPKHLFNEKEFWTPYPVPTASLDDPTFSGGGEWNGQRLVCPWNGRTWLMTNSHVAEALCQAAHVFNSALKPQAVEFLNRFIRMLFLDGDLERPSSFEYYNPFTGQAPFFRGTEDYMHSWIVDLIIKYVAGVQPDENGRLIIRPLPFNLDYFTLDRLKIRGKALKVTWRKDQNAQAASGKIDPSDRSPVGLAVSIEGKIEIISTSLEDNVIQL